MANADKPGSAMESRPEMVVTIGIDGKIYCNDLTPELLSVMTDVCPTDSDLLARLALMDSVRQEGT